MSGKIFSINQTKNKSRKLPTKAGRLLYLWSLVVLLGLGTHSTYAQTTKIDSLRAILSTATTDLERATVMNELSSSLEKIDEEEGLLYAKKALELSRQVNDKEAEVKALFNIGVLTYDSPQRDSAFSYFEDGERMAAKAGLKKLQADHLMKIAKWYRYRLLDSAKTVEYLLKSVEVSKAVNYDYGTGRSYAKLASFYTKYNEINLCEAYLEKSAEYYMRIENGGEEVAHYYNEVGSKIWDYHPRKSIDFYLKGMEYWDNYPNIKISIGKAYSKIGEPKIALEYLEAAISDISKPQHARMLGIASALLAEVHVQLGNYEAASKTCDESIVLLDSLSRNSQRALPHIYRIKGLLMEREGNEAAALEYYTKSLNKANEIEVIFERLQSDLVLGEFYLSKDPEKSKKFCEKSLRGAQRRNYSSLAINACDCLYKIYEKNKLHEKALKYYVQKTILSDSLSTLNIEHALDINKRLSEKDKQLSEQSYQKEIKDEQLKNQYILNTTLFISTFLGLLLVGFLSLSVKRISKQHKEITKKTAELENTNLSLERSNEELERFAYIASHDLKTPLRNIIGFTGILRNSLNAEEKPIVKDSLSFIETSGKRMIQLIEDVLEYSKLSNQMTNKSEYEAVNLNDLVTEISNIILNKFDGKIVDIQISKLPIIKWNSSKIFLLLKNLIENGLKYNESQNPTIKVYSTLTSEAHILHIEDNGIGIEKEYFGKIFLMFKRLHSENKYEGTGLGLATCKKIVDEFEGKIDISSEIDKGTTFKIEIPNKLICQHTDNNEITSPTTS